MAFESPSPAKRANNLAEPTRRDAGFEFWIWHKARRVRCVILDTSLEKLAGMPVKRESQLLAVYFRYRRQLHDAAHDQIDRGVATDPVRLDPDLFEPPQPPRSGLVAC